MATKETRIQITHSGESIDNAAIGSAFSWLLAQFEAADIATADYINVGITLPGGVRVEVNMYEQPPSKE